MLRRVDQKSLDGHSEPAPPRSGFSLARSVEQRQQPRFSHLLAVLLVAGATGISALLFPLDDPENLVMVYLLAVVLAALYLGRGPSILATLLGIAAFVWFFVPHYNSFELADLYYLPTFAIMLAVALVVSTLTSRLRASAILTEERERRSIALYELSRELAAVDRRSDLATVVDRHVRLAFSCDSALLELVSGTFVRLGLEEHSASLEVAALQQALAARRAVQSGSSVLQPMVVAGEPVGLLACEGLDLQWFRSASNLQLLESFANNIGVALHRLVVGEQVLKARQHVEDERLRNVMLSSVSHDLRTPLASITGAVTTLIESSKVLDDATRLDLMQSIREDADALERQVRNLLDLTRLESGSVVAQRDWHSVEEVVGCAMRRVESVLLDREVTIALSPDLPLVSIDAMLVEQMLVNLLENAAKYAHKDRPVEVDARIDGDDLWIAVRDRGKGLDAEERERVFAKFYRGPGQQQRPGAGLGLAICRAVAELHGGTIQCNARDGGGAEFVARLPLLASTVVPPIGGEPS